VHVAIDLLAETPATLRLAARLLLDHADVIEGKTPANVPAGTSGNIPPPPPVVPVPPAPPASNVLPFVPPAPSATVAAIPDASTMAPPAAPMVPAAALPATSAPVPPAPAATAPVVPPAQITGVIERDSAGVPWDARIHQKTKGVKKDKTWKLIKGIDPALVTAVVQELSAKGLIQTPAAVGASSAPVSLPPGIPPAPAQQGSQGYQAGQLPIPQAPGQAEAQAHIPPAPGGAQAQAVIPPAPAASVPVPPATVLGMPDAGNSGVVQIDFRGLVAKFTNARNAGKLTPQQITEIINQAGAPSLQLLGSMAHLVPVADALLDAALLQA
jgi:hypothetical protein